VSVLATRGRLAGGIRPEVVRITTMTPAAKISDPRFSVMRHGPFVRQGRRRPVGDRINGYLGESLDKTKLLSGRVEECFNPISIGAQ
jgi:hypothetical protein